ncbi:hypothetical protein [Nocardia asteroides]|uniref:hypothetical protein n=1 Tax=Nocardia asteroides TaxID=1824 RepID=UPI0034333AAC
MEDNPTHVAAALLVLDHRAGYRGAMIEPAGSSMAWPWRVSPSVRLADIPVHPLDIFSSAGMRLRE